MTLRPEPIDDVPSPIDFRTLDDARAWAESAMLKRPWREDVFRRFAEELAGLEAASGAILELGSGPGFLAQRLLEALPSVEYTAFDFSPAMHSLAQERLGPLARRVRFVLGDFKAPGWTASLARYHAVVTLQAVHELRHKAHAAGLYRAVRDLLLPDGRFLMCDHFVGDGGMTDGNLHMTPGEHEQALLDGGFPAPLEVYRAGSLVLYRAG